LSQLLFSTTVWPPRAARGDTLSDEPDLEVNFIVGTKDKIESSPAGVG
jgi:hypothetical protein